jgi:hypothetical protein
LLNNEATTSKSLLSSPDFWSIFNEYRRVGGSDKNQLEKGGTNRVRAWTCVARQRHQILRYGDKYFEIVKSLLSSSAFWTMFNGCAFAERLKKNQLEKSGSNRRQARRSCFLALVPEHSKLGPSTRQFAHAEGANRALAIVFVRCTAQRCDHCREPRSLLPCFDVGRLSTCKIRRAKLYSAVAST